ncbi:uncharacterized protein LOC128033991 [Gossypium raimondii]|uniref:uncharacterized protein LOC128033991 n=1 Tax=Gossypium raimondii TaxID=29730 RepID=UPI00227C38F7|nr:uncharacterized protein LOC128033991 [Gossypium raimondii]
MVIIYDMLNGQNNSGFGWDEHRQLVVAEDAVWESYVKSHKEASQFRHRSFPYYNQLTAIYARDRATGKDAQTAADVLEEIHAEDERTTDMNEERNTFYDCETDVSLDDMDVSGTDPRGDRDQGGFTHIVSIRHEQSLKHLPTFNRTTLSLKAEEEGNNDSLIELTARQQKNRIVEGFDTSTAPHPRFKAVNNN